MKKIILLLLVLTTGVLSNGYADSQGYEKLGQGLKNMTNSFAIANGVTLLHAGTWNTAYIGKITDVKFGVGFNITFGIHNVIKLKNNKLASALKKLASDLKKLDFGSIPGLGLSTPFSVRLGGYGKAPIDFGLYFAYVPYNKFFNAQKMGMDDFFFNSRTLGMDVRYAVLGEGSDFAISIGLAYLYQQNNVKYTIKNASIEEKDVSNNSVTIDLSNFGIRFDAFTHTVGLRAQLSKSYLFNFLEFSLALEPFFTVSNFMVETSGGLAVKNKGKAWRYSDYVNKNATITNAKFVKNGHIDFKSTSVNGGLRLFFGSSTKLWVLYLDTNIGYEPFSSTVLASCGIRIGL